MVGNTPWAEPTQMDDEFVAFLRYFEFPEDFLNVHPWNTFSESQLFLLLGMLNPNAQNRYDMQKILENSWFTNTNPFLDEQLKCSDPAGLTPPLC